MKTVGVDEAGRGAWAGPIVAAAVLVDERFNIDKLTDSKKLTKIRRNIILQSVQVSANEIGIGFVSAKEIDEIGLGEANRKAMQLAVSQISNTYDELLVDGNIKFLEGSRAIIGGDGIEKSISAASVVAKVFRDRYMLAMSTIFHNYGFENHVGYGSAAHKQAITLRGICNIHRKSFKPISQVSLF